jgi:DNA-binding CsgD family transcriptional regulator
MKPTNPHYRRWLSPQPDLITDRERAVGALLASGLTPSEIADRMGITLHMVGNDRRMLYAKLKLRGPVALTHYAIRHGWTRLHGTRGPKKEVRP